MELAGRDWKSITYIQFGDISGAGRAFYTKNGVSRVYNTARCCLITAIFLLAERFAIVMRMLRDLRKIVGILKPRKLPGFGNLEIS